MIGLYHSDSCCGCGVCGNVCPKNAIEIKPDEEGFLYPEISEERCVDCGLCRKMCAYQNEDKELRTVLKTYAAQYRNDDVVKHSASGGVFACLAEAFTDDGGYVCGAVMDFEDNTANVHHIISNKKKDITRMQGSKYVQSSLHTCLGEIKRIVKQGDKVLFCGTPCQTAAVKQLTGDPGNLFTIDIICHGVPSLAMFNSFLGYDTRKSDEIIDFIFRDKTVSLSYCGAKLIRRKKKRLVRQLRPAHLTAFYNYFLKSAIDRNNCYSCPYAGAERIGDITIGDYWGLNKQHAEDVDSGRIDISKAWSCMLVNSEKGIKLADIYGRDIYKIESELKKAAAANAQLNHPSIRHPERETILKLYKKNGYAAVEKYYRKRKGIKIYGLKLRNYLFHY